MQSCFSMGFARNGDACVKCTTVQQRNANKEAIAEQRGGLRFAGVYVKRRLSDGLILMYILYMYI